MKLTKSVLELLFPPKCVFCRSLMENGNGRICPRCRRELPLTCSPAPGRYPHLAAVASPLFYEGNVRQSLLRYKFGGLTAYAPVYAELMAESVRWECPGCEVITWAPLSRRRRFRRGYDQAQLLAEELGRRLNLPVEPMLRKVRNAPPQSSMKSAETRRKNIAGCYEALPGRPPAGRRILLVDDIFTTGSTLSECASVLKAAGAGEICGVTAARGRAFPVNTRS